MQTLKNYLHATMSQGANEGNALSKQRSKSSKKKQNPGDRASNPGGEDDPQNQSKERC